MALRSGLPPRASARWQRQRLRLALGSHRRGPTSRRTMPAGSLLPAYVDEACFAAVCPQWHAAAWQVPLPPPLRLLALLRQKKKEDQAPSRS